MPDPTFLIIGAQKCATTWLADMLRQHPDVCVPRRKEIHFFDKDAAYARGLDWYRRQFDEHRGEAAVGEATPNYLWIAADEAERRESDQTANPAALVRRHYPDVKLVVSLRDPVERAVSAYYHHIRARRIRPGDALRDVAHRFGIVSMGRYATQLRPWTERFPPEQLLILVVEEDIRPAPARAVERVFRFLGVDPGFTPSGLHEERHTRSGGLYLHLNHYVPRLTRWLRLDRSPLERIDWPAIRVAAADRERLARLYAEENRRLEDLLQRRLDRWTRPG